MSTRLLLRSLHANFLTSFRAVAAKRRLDVILVWKLDRAFRSVAHMASTVEQLRQWGVGLRSYTELGWTRPVRRMSPI